MAQKQSELHDAALSQDVLRKKIKEIEDFNVSNIEQYDFVKEELESAKSLRNEVSCFIFLKLLQSETEVYELKDFFYIIMNFLETNSDVVL